VPGGDGGGAVPFFGLIGPTPASAPVEARRQILLFGFAFRQGVSSVSSEMSITKRKVAIAAVLAIAVCVLIVDRALIDPSATGPEQAAAAAEPVEEFDVPDVAKLPLHPPSPAEDRKQTLSDWLQAYATRQRLDVLSVGDAFKPSESWGIGHKPDPKPPPPPPEPEVKEAPKPPKPRRLTATVVTGTGGIAIINGQCFHVGQLLDEMRLVSVKQGSATLKAPDGRLVTIYLVKDSAAGGADE